MRTSSQTSVMTKRLKGKCRARSKLKHSFDLTGMNLIVEHILPKPFPVWPSRLSEILTSSLEDNLLPRIWQSLSTLLQAQDDQLVKQGGYQLFLVGSCSYWLALKSERRRQRFV